MANPAKGASTIRLRRAITNDDIADGFERIADLLEVQDGDWFRIRAYRNGAETLRRLSTPVGQLLLRGGTKELEGLPGIGEALARSIREFVTTGRLAMLERLEGSICPEDLFRTVPGVGPELARRIHEELGIETLEELEQAAHDGRLEGIQGFGERRVRGIRETLASVLGRATRRRAHGRRWRSSDRGRLYEFGEPIPASVATLLALDSEYREKADSGKLPRIAPRRFNPSGEAWLPILHTTRDGVPYTVLYSNTARAHELGRTRDWVVIYADQDGVGERRYTVVTEYQGPLAGRRVVRGCEEESYDHYMALAEAPPGRREQG